MKNTLDEHNRSMDPLCCFHHRYTFYVSNLHEIVSAQVVNSRTDYYQPVDKTGYFWGQYEVQVSYRRPKDRGDTRQKVFTHGFLINVPYSLPGFSKDEQQKYVCEATCSYQAAPFLLMLFPFFSRINFVPFKVVLNVTGRIRESTGETISGRTECRCVESMEECSCLGKEAWDGEGWEDKAAEAVNPVDDDGDRVKGEEDLVDLDLIALEKKEISRDAGAKSNHFRGYNRYYNMLIEHQENIQQPQTKNKATVEKAVGNKRQKKPQR